MPKYRLERAIDSFDDIIQSGIVAPYAGVGGGSNVPINIAHYSTHYHGQLFADTLPDTVALTGTASKLALSTTLHEDAIATTMPADGEIQIDIANLYPGLLPDTELFCSVTVTLMGAASNNNSTGFAALGLDGVAALATATQFEFKQAGSTQQITFAVVALIPDQSAISLFLQSDSGNFNLTVYSVQYAVHGYHANYPVYIDATGTYQGIPPGGGGDMEIHDLSGAWHTGTLDPAQAPWAVTDTEFSAHTGNADAHHAKVHGIVDNAVHDVTAPPMHVVGTPNANELGMITGTSNSVGRSLEFLYCNASGGLEVGPFAAQSMQLAGDLDMTYGGGGNIIMSAAATVDGVDVSLLGIDFDLLEQALNDHLAEPKDTAHDQLLSWAQLNKVDSDLRDLATRRHGDLQNITSSDHHNPVTASPADFVVSGPLGQTIQLRPEIARTDAPNVWTEPNTFQDDVTFDLDIHIGQDLYVTRDTFGGRYGSFIDGLTLGSAYQPSAGALLDVRGFSIFEDTEARHMVADSIKVVDFVHENKSTMLVGGSLMVTSGGAMSLYENVPVAVAGPATLDIPIEDSETGHFLQASAGDYLRIVTMYETLPTSTGDTLSSVDTSEPLEDIAVLELGDNSESFATVDIWLQITGWTDAGTHYIYHTNVLDPSTVPAGNFPRGAAVSGYRQASDNYAYGYLKMSANEGLSSPALSIYRYGGEVDNDPRNAVLSGLFGTLYDAREFAGNNQFGIAAGGDLSDPLTHGFVVGDDSLILRQTDLKITDTLGDALSINVDDGINIVSNPYLERRLTFTDHQGHILGSFGGVAPFHQTRDWGGQIFDFDATLSMIAPYQDGTGYVMALMDQIDPETGNVIAEDVPTPVYIEKGARILLASEAQAGYSDARLELSTIDIGGNISRATLSGHDTAVSGVSNVTVSSNNGIAKMRARRIDMDGPIAMHSVEYYQGAVVDEVVLAARSGGYEHPILWTNGWLLYWIDRDGNETRIA